MWLILSILILTIALNRTDAKDYCTEHRCNNRLLENVMNFDIKYSNLEQRLSSLETHNEDLKKKVDTQQSQIETYNATIRQLKTKNEDLQQRLVHVENKVEDFALNTLNFSHTLQTIQSKHASLEKQGENFNLTLQKIRIVGSATDSVAFTARLSSHMLYTSENDVVFDNVITNVGNGYNSSTGTFVAPSAGVYLFSLTIFTLRAYVCVQLVKNSELLGWAYADGKSSASYDTASAILLTTLENGDIVYVKYKVGATDWDYVLHSEYSQFSGFRIE